MIKRHNEWEKTKVKEIYATNKGIYLRPYSQMVIYVNYLVRDTLGKCGVNLKN